MLSMLPELDAVGPPPLLRPPQWGPNFVDFLLVETCP